jgi:hypothetical protein
VSAAKHRALPPLIAATNCRAYPVTGNLNLGFNEINSIAKFWEWLNPGQFLSGGGFNFSFIVTRQ